MIDLDERLRDTGRDLVLQTPLTEVTERGLALRQRRRARRAGVAVAASAALVGGMLAVTNASTRPEPAPTARDLVSAGWSSSLNSLPATELRTYADLCSEMAHSLDGFHGVPPSPAGEAFDATPVASARVSAGTGELAVLVFHDAESFATCVVDPDGPDGAFVTMSQYLPRLKRTGDHVTPTGTYGSTDLAVATGLTSAEVTDVRVTVAGKPVAATVEDGIFAAVVPSRAGRETMLGATVAAYGADGALLEEVPLLP